MAFHWYLARKRVSMMCLILVWRSNCRNIRKEYGKLLCSIAQQKRVTNFNLYSGAGQHPRQWGEGEDHLQQVGHSQREVSLIRTRPQLHDQSHRQEYHQNYYEFTTNWKMDLLLSCMDHYEQYHKPVALVRDLTSALSGLKFNLGKAMPPDCPEVLVWCCMISFSQIDIC